MHRYPSQDIAAIYRVIAERRDMRHFLPEPIDPAVLGRLLEAAHQAPSVGLMQPWRVVRVTDPALRREIHALVDEERQRTADALGRRGGIEHRYPAPRPTPLALGSEPEVLNGAGDRTEIHLRQRTPPKDVGLAPLAERGVSPQLRIPSTLRRRNSSRRQRHPEQGPRGADDS